jgi:hypothetical protein
MARRTFFSFHYENDVWRAGVVRNSDVVKQEPSEWIDASLWEDAKKKGDAAIIKLINYALVGTSVTAVLIGTDTATRRWVQYEIDKSIERGNGLLGIYIHKIKDRYGNTGYRGSNPLPTGYKTYDWVDDNGYANLGTWVDIAYNSR